MNTEQPIGNAQIETTIRPPSAFRLLDFSELWRNRDLFCILAWRDCAVRYKQTVLGVAWAVLRPLLLMFIFIAFVGPVVQGKANSETPLPYPVFVYCGVLLWTLFSSALSSASESVIGAERLITKVYFPRLLIPFAATVPALVDFAVGLLLMLGVLVYWGVMPAWTAFGVVMVAGVTIGWAMAIGAMLAGLNVVYRDVRYAVPFFIQAGLFATPAIYRPDVTGTLVTINPVNAMCSTFRALLIGQPMEMVPLTIALAIMAITGFSAVFIFRQLEGSLADKI